MFAASACLPKSHSSSIRTPTPFVPPTVLESAASTFSVAPLPRCVIVLMCDWTCVSADSSSSACSLHMSRAGSKLFPAICTVGARMLNVAACRQFRISAVSMIPAASVDFEFFFGRQTNHSVTRRRPESASYAPKIDATRSNTHSPHASPNVGDPCASTIRSSRKIRSPSAACSGNSGAGMIERPARRRSAQSTQAVERSAATDQL